MNSKKSKVAIIDGNSDSRKLFSDLFGYEGLDCVDCAPWEITGKEGEEDFFSKNNPNIVFWNICPPIKESWEYCRNVKNSEACMGKRFIVTCSDKRFLQRLAKEEIKLGLEVVPFDIEGINEVIRGISSKEREINLPNIGKEGKL